MPNPLPSSPIYPPHQGPSIYYQGPDLSEGIRPAVIFFALSAHSSLYEDPFNQPVLALAEAGIRVFSWDLPFHGLTFDHNEAMRQWGIELARKASFISDFIEICQQHIQYLIDQGWVDPHSLAVAGLSRGGFIATHLAAADPRIKTVLGFAPLTRAPHVDEFKSLFSPHYEAVGLIHLVDRLIHTRLRFYIGNHDKRVSTDACYEFISTLAKTAVEAGVRSPSTELIIYPCIGFKGHGTPPAIFQAGASWIKSQLLN